jgi:hypothetical protein
VCSVENLGSQADDAIRTRNQQLGRL